MLFVVFLIGVTAIVIAELVVVAASAKKLKHHRNGRFYESYGGKVLELEFMYIVIALAFTIGLAWLSVIPRKDPGFVLVLMVADLIAPFIITVRAVWIMTYPDTVVRRWHLNRRQDSTLTGPIRTGVPLDRIRVGNLDKVTDDD